MLTAPLARGGRSGDRYLRPAARRSLRQLIERHFGADSEADERRPVGFADLVRLRGGPAAGSRIWYSMHAFCAIRTYDPILRARTGLDPAVGAYIEADPDYQHVFRPDRRVSLTWSCRVSFKRARNTLRSRSGVPAGDTARFISSRSWPPFGVTDRLARRPAMRGGWRLHVTHRELAREGHRGWRTDGSARCRGSGDATQDDMRDARGTRAGSGTGGLRRRP